MQKLNFLFSLLLITLIVSCGEVQQATNPPPPPPAQSGSTSSDPNHPTGNTILVLAAEFGGNGGSAIGSLNTISADSSRAVGSDLTLTHSDAELRVFQNRIYVINRLGGDNIQVVDPKSFKTLYQFSTGVGTNPQDLISLSATKAYVTLYQPEENQTSGKKVDDLILFNPTTGEISQTFDLTTYTQKDGDRFARASSMVQIGTKIFVAIQDMPGNLALPPDQQGRLARINSETDRIESVTLLNCRDPFTMTYSPETEKIYIGCSDFFDLESPYGGIEVVEPTTLTSEGIYLDDLVLGGSVGEIEVSGMNGFVVVAPIDFSENRVVRFSLDESQPDLKTVYTSKGYLQNLAIDPEGKLLIADRDPEVSGVVFLNPESGEVEETISVGLPPSSFSFVER